MSRKLLVRVAPAFLVPALAAFSPAPAPAGPFAGQAADVFVLGEVHDNPDHHLAQAEALRDIAPRAVVFEMLTEAQAEAFDPALVDDRDALDATLGWTESGWPVFAIYYPVFESLGQARVYGAAVPRAEARAAFEAGVADSFGPEAGRYGLTEALDAAQHAARLEMQDAAHCHAVPEEVLVGMIELQRLRDATLARAALTALEDTGGPVAIITGNGHARADWGVPAYIARVAPEAVLRTLGQGEDGSVPEGGFDVVLDAPGVDRDDPCAAFE